MPPPDPETVSLCPRGGRGLGDLIWLELAGQRASGRALGKTFGSRPPELCLSRRLQLPPSEYRPPHLGSPPNPGPGQSPGLKVFYPTLRTQSSPQRPGTRLSALSCHMSNSCREPARRPHHRVHFTDTDTEAQRSLNTDPRCPACRQALWALPCLSDCHPPAQATGVNGATGHWCLSPAL